MTIGILLTGFVEGAVATAVGCAFSVAVWEAFVSFKAKRRFRNVIEELGSLQQQKKINLPRSFALRTFCELAKP